jgi:hypothetical protein
MLLLLLWGCQWSATWAQDRPIRCRATRWRALLRRCTAKGWGLLLKGWPRGPLRRRELLLVLRRTAILRGASLWRPRSLLRRPLRRRRHRRQQLGKLLQGRRQL